MNAYDTLIHAASNANDPMPLSDHSGPPLMRLGKDKGLYNLGDLLLIVFIAVTAFRSCRIQCCA